MKSKGVEVAGNARDKSPRHRGNNNPSNRMLRGHTGSNTKSWLWKGHRSFLHLTVFWGC